MRFHVAFARATMLPVTVGWSAPLLVAIAVAVSYDAGATSAQNALGVATTLVAILLALFTHEWAHAAAAFSAGGRVTRVHIGGLSANVDVAGVAMHQRGAVYAAGPVMNLSIATAAGVLALLSHGHVAEGLRALSWWSFVTGTFNLLPFPGFDGGSLAALGAKARVARGSAWTMAGVVVLTYVAAVLMTHGGLTGLLLGLPVVLGGCVGAWAVGWHGVLPPLREPHNEWGDVVEA